MESRDDSTNAERILRNIVPVSQLVNNKNFFVLRKRRYSCFQLDVGCEIYARGKQEEMEEKSGQETENDEILHEEDNNENSDNVAQTVGHNMYILAYQV